MLSLIIIVTFFLLIIYFFFIAKVPANNEDGNANNIEKDDKGESDQKKESKVDIYKGLEKFDKTKSSLSEYLWKNHRVKIIYGGHAKSIRAHRNNIIKAIKNDFNISECELCNGSNYTLLKFNSDCSSAELSCKNCNAIVWFESNDIASLNDLKNDSIKFNEWHDKLEKLRTVTGLDKGTVFSVKIQSGKNRFREYIDLEDWDRHIAIDINGPR